MAPISSYSRRAAGLLDEALRVLEVGERGVRVGAQATDHRPREVGPAKGDQRVFDPTLRHSLIGKCLRPPEIPEAGTGQRWTQLVRLT